MKVEYDIINKYGRFQINMRAFIYPTINFLVNLLFIIPRYILIPKTLYRYLQIEQGILEFRNVLLLLIFENDNNAHYYFDDYRHPYCFATVKPNKPNTLQYDNGIKKEFKDVKEYIKVEKSKKF